VKRRGVGAGTTLEPGSRILAGPMTPIDINRLHPAGADPRPVLLGLAGDSASGKSTLGRGIEYILGAERVARICTDDYHLYDREERARLGVTPLDPDANRMALMGEQLRALSEGRPVEKPVYDHATGTFGEPEKFEPAEIIVVEGLLPLVDRMARDCINVAVFLEPDEALRLAWKLARDTTERGYTPEQVRSEIERRETDSAAHVRPQRDFADIVVRFHGEPNAGEASPLSARLAIRPTLPYPGLRELIGSLSGRGEEPIRWSLATDRRGPMSVLDIDGSCPADLGAEIEDVIWSYLRPDDRIQRDRIGMVQVPGGGGYRSDALALAQLLIVSHLVGALDGAFEL